MRKYRFKKLIARVLTACMSVIIMTLTVYAADELTDTQVGYLKDHMSESWVSSYITTDSSQAGTNSPVIIDGSTYYYKSGVDSKILGSRIDKAIKTNNVSTDVSNITDGIGVTADTAGAADILRGGVPILNLLLGIVLVVVISATGLYTCFDIAFITLPVFRTKCDDAVNSGNTGMLVKKSGSGSKLRFVTDEAQYVVANATLEQGKSAMFEYIKLRIKALALLAIAITILATNNISIITNIAVKVVSGLMGVLGGLA